MAASREEEAADYLKKHRIMELVENLSSLLLFYRPGHSSLSLSAGSEGSALGKPAILTKHKEDGKKEINIYY
uniref:Uncharacterized protein n=1 Tax=Sphaeramia orbicularis TaxID=375764 RepID=A0A673A8B5_9TELE